MHIAKIEGKSELRNPCLSKFINGITDFRKLHVNSFNEATLAIDLALHGSWQNFICNVSIIL